MPIMPTELNRDKLEGLLYYLNCLDSNTNIPINSGYLAKIVEMALDFDFDYGK